MCNCITEMNKALDEAGYNTEVGTLTFTNLRTVVEIASYVKEKKRGAKAVKITPIFCPFCGEKYEVSS